MSMVFVSNPIVGGLPSVITRSGDGKVEVISMQPATPVLDTAPEPIKQPSPLMQAFTLPDTAYCLLGGSTQPLMSPSMLATPARSTLAARSKAKSPHPSISTEPVPTWLSSTDTVPPIWSVHG